MELPDIEKIYKLYEKALKTDNQSCVQAAENVLQSIAAAEAAVAEAAVFSKFLELSC